MLYKIQTRVDQKLNGMCIVVGSGMLMSVMDCITSASRFFEYKDINESVARQVILFGHYSDYIYIDAWFSISKPNLLFRVLDNFPEKKIYHRMNVDYTRGTKFESLKEASDFLNDVHVDIDADARL
jgi:hypothetical protein